MSMHRLTIGLILLFAGTPLWAQQLKPKPLIKKSGVATGEANEKTAVAAVANAKELVDSIYQKCSNAKNAKELTAGIEQCRSALNKNLGQENIDYLRSLLGWTLNQRAGKRIDTADAMLTINQEQANVILQNALADVEESLKINADNWRAYLNRGVINTRTEKLKEATADFEKVCAMVKEKTNGWFNLGEVLYAQKKYESAAEKYKVVLTVSANDVQSLTGLAHCYVRLDKTEQAIETFATVVKLRPENPNALINRGDAYLQAKKWKNAFADYSAAAKIDSKSIAYQRAAWLLATCPDDENFMPETALSLANKAIELHGETWANLEALAAAQAATGEFVKAKQTQIKAIATAKKLDANFETGPLKSRLELYSQEKIFQLPGAESKNQ